MALIIQSFPFTSSATEVTSSIPGVTIQVESTKYPNVISAGDTFKFEFAIKKDGNYKVNTNNLYVDFETTEGLTITASSNRMKLNNFNNDGISTYQAEFEVSPEVAGGKQAITMNFIYEYDNGGTMEPGSSSAKIRIPVNGVQAPTLSLSDKEYTKNVEAGKKLTLSYNLKNDSTKYSVQNLSVSFTPSEGLTSLADSSTYVVDTLAAGASSEKKLVFQATSTATAKQTVTFNYKFDYTIDSQVFHAEGTDLIPITLATAESNSNIPYVVVGSYDYGDTVKSGEDFTLRVKFKNSSKDYKIENVTITVGGTDGLISQDASNKVFINEIKKDASASKAMRFKTKDDVASGYQTVSFQIKYEYVKDGVRVQAETSEQANIQVKGKSTGSDSDKSNVATPYMMVKAYDYGDKVAAGSNFNLHLEIQNTSETVNMENIVVSMETAEDLSIASSSNTFYIKKMQAGNVQKKDIELQALASAKAKSATVTLNFKYEYVDKKTRTQVTSSEQISIPIFQPDRVEFELTPVAEGMPAGSETAISVQYVNKGKGTVYNVSAEVVGSAECAEPIQNIGNFEAGANGTIDFYVTPLEAGDVSGQIVVNYEDDNMEVKKVEIPYSFMVTENVPIDDMGGMDEGGMIPEEGKKNSNTKTIVTVVAGILALLVVIAVILVIIKKKKKAKLQKLQDLEDMKDDE